MAKKKANADAEVLAEDLREERPFRLIFQGLADEDDSELIMCQSNIEWEDKLHMWKQEQKAKDAKKKLPCPFASVSDDRFPGWTWIGRLYHDSNHVVIPKLNIFRCLVEASMKFKLPGGKGNETFKTHIAAGVQLAAGPVLLMHRNQPIPVGFLKDIEDNHDWPTQQAAVRQAGFLLDVRRVGLSGQGSSMVRVRPKFKFWHIEFGGTLTAQSISSDMFETIVKLAGERCGLGDWRPSNGSPGRHGAFKATVTWL